MIALKISTKSNTAGTTKNCSTGYNSKSNYMEPTTEELEKLISNLNGIADNVPRGLSQLQDALTFAIFDLTAHTKRGITLSGFLSALEFARSIPLFTDYDSDAFNHWLIHDDAYIKYFN
jgi:hypothetical protein